MDASSRDAGGFSIEFSAASTHEPPKPRPVCAGETEEKLGATTNNIGVENERCKHSRGRRAGVERDAVEPIDLWHHLHGDDRQLAIRLDAVRRTDRSEVPLGSSSDSSRLHDLRLDGNVAGSG